MSASRKSSKRTASQAVPQPDVIVIDDKPDTKTADTTAPQAHMQAQPDTMQTETVSAKEPAATTAADATIPAADATSEEESTLHKAKKMATEASHQVQVAVTQGLEAAGVAFKSASAATSDAFHSAQAKIADATAPTPTAAQGPYNVKAGDLKPTEPPTASTLDKAKATLIHASEVIQEKAEQAYESLAAKSQSSGLTDGVKSASSTVSASVNAAVEKVSAAIHGGSTEVAHDDVSMTDAKAGVSDASHSVEKHDGSLPVERNADEFPHPRKHETPMQSKLLEQAIAGQSGIESDKVADLPLGSAKTSDATAGSTSSTSSGTAGDKKMLDTNPDLLTGPALSTHIGV